ncbi:MAG: hypothetical protein U0451_03000 [Candidatus Saccharimonadales bacterium]
MSRNFSNFTLGDSVYDIGDNVLQEIATAFEYDLTVEPSVDNLGGLIGVVGPAKELQENIGEVQRRLGVNGDSLSLATDWVKRSGLLTPVARSFATPEYGIDDTIFDVAVITGGVRNWMMRRANRLVEEKNKVRDVYLVAGNRAMKTSEGEDVEEGMTESDYMQDVVNEVLKVAGLRVEIARVESSVGNEVMAMAADGISPTATVLISSNAGAWVQNSGQLRRALRDRHSNFDKEGDRLFVISDEFPLGTGKETTATHQNPFSALGQIARNAQEIVRHQ